MLENLIKIANELDQKGLIKEASHLDYIISKIASKPVRLSAGDPYEYTLSSDGNSFTAVHTGTGKKVGPFKNADVIAKIKAKSGVQSSAPQASGKAQAKPPSARNDPSFGKDVGLRDEDAISNRSAGGQALAYSLKALATAAKPVATAVSATAPLGIGFLVEFLALRTSQYNITSPDIRRAMHFACMSAKKRGAKSLGYSDYQNGQKLDPSRKAVTSPTYRYGDAVAILKSYDPYAQLSLGLGGCSIRGGDEKSGFSVTDVYNYNLDRDPTSVELASNYIASIPNIEALIERIKGDKVGGGSLAANVEECLVMYEHTLRYTGFPVSIQTIPPDASLSMTDQFRDIFS